jgi:hypothetical protein
MNNLIQMLFPWSKDDPVLHCNVYKTVGCAHVDGMLCNMKTCDVKVQLEITPRGKTEIFRAGRYEGET